MADNLKLIWAPAVCIIGRQTVDRREVARFLLETGYTGLPLDYAESDAENLVELSGRLCYRSYGRGRSHDDYMRHILEVGHGSVTEHAVWTLFIIGISRTCSHELVRHRHLSPSQESQRYVDAGEVAFVVPPLLVRFVRAAIADDDAGAPEAVSRSQAGINGAGWLFACSSALATYRLLSKALLMETINQHYPQDGVQTPEEAEAWAAKHQGVSMALVKQAREAARSVLPGCAETRIALTGNARAWRNLIELRCSRHADAEIRRLACAVLEALAKEAPNLFGDYKRDLVGDGTFEATTKWKKV